MDINSTVENYWRVQKQRKLNEIIYLQIQSPPNFLLVQIYNYALQKKKKTNNTLQYTHYNWATYYRSLEKVILLSK